MNYLHSGTPVAFLYVRDRERALGFYRGTLGFQLRSSDEFGDFIPALGWNVGDISATVKALRDDGIVFNFHEGMGQDALGIWTSPDGRSKVAFFSDPDGNVLTLSQA